MVTLQDFQTDQIAYLEMHKDKFEDTDENKLEYTTIHEGYVLILEQQIDEELKNIYAKPEIDSFYATFQDHFDSYQKENLEVVETLMDFIDFKKFKKTILEYKAGSVDKAGMEDDNAKDLKCDLAEKLDIDVFEKLYNEEINNRANGWTKRSQMRDNKIGASFVIFSRPMESGLHMLRSECHFKGLTIQTFNDYLLNMEKMANAPHLTEFKIVEKHEDGMPRIFYQKVKMTGMSERESLLRLEKLPQPDGRVLFITSSVEHPDYPITNQVIRMETYKATMAEDTHRGLKSTEFSNFNIKGWFPLRLLNMMIG